MADAVTKRCDESRPKTASREVIGTLGELPLNLLWVPGLPALAELRALGVRRPSAGSALAQRTYGAAHRAALRFLESGDLDAADAVVANPEMNALFA